MKELRIGIFLGLRQIQRSSIWTTLLVISVILFTFLNLVLLSGVLNGIIDGALREVRSVAIGDITIDPLEDETRILETERLIRELRTYPEITALSARYVGPATLEANHQTRRRLSDEQNIISVNVTGIDPIEENETSGLSRMVTEGSYLDPNESGYILLGKFNVDRYAAEFGDVFESLENIYPGDPVLVTANGQSREFIVKGIVTSKVDLVSTSVYIPEVEFRRMFERTDYNANQIALRLIPGSDEVLLRDQLRASPLGNLAKIDSFEDGIPKSTMDIRETFDILGIFTGAIGLIVASITIFIVVFINALSRRRQIGILKAIGITRRSIEYAYIIQAVFYACIGATLGIIITHFALVPYFIENPINFPFSNASLSIDLEGMFIRSAALIFVSLVAGFVPAWIITRQNTLSAVLGRK